uniref:Uncharacterized protein n=1 Tax=Acrobeloides nanus TaxID=290746 RepID=A0A914CTW7_9BILA
MKKTRVRPLHSLIFQREIGQYKSLINHCADIYKALLLSERRVYMREMEYNSQGNVNYEDGHLFAENEKKYFNITDGNYQHFEFPPMNTHEKVVATLAYACGDFCQIAKAHYRFLIILTSFGRLIFYDYSKHKIAYCFHLPADKYKFKKLEWNRENHSFWISGAEREPGEERTQGRRGKTHVVVVFEVDPIKFRAMFEVDSQV